MDALLELISSTPSNPSKPYIQDTSPSPSVALYSGRIIGVRSQTLSKFAVDLSDVIPDAEFDDVQQLQNLAILEADRRYSAEWDAVIPKDIVKIIADSTRGSGQEEVLAFA